jgi:hypothetical protein
MPSEEWSQIVLNFQASVQGVQFDRYGAMWINGIEILRLTTPEPNERGITWEVQKDITYTKSYLIANQHALTAYLTIPNNVDSTYTGVISVDISLTFYRANSNYTEHTIIDSADSTTTIRKNLRNTKINSQSDIKTTSKTTPKTSLNTYDTPLTTPYTNTFISV